MIIHSTQFGELNVSAEQVLKFPEGLPGFPEETDYALVPYADDSPFAILQSATEPALTFIVAETFVFFPDYTFELDDQLAGRFGFSSDNLPHIFSILTVRGTMEETTANLAAPVLVNWQDHIAAQVVLERTTYTTRHPLFSGQPPAQLAGGDK